MFYMCLICYSIWFYVGALKRVWFNHAHVEYSGKEDFLVGAELSSKSWVVIFVVVRMETSILKNIWH